MIRTILGGILLFIWLAFIVYIYVKTFMTVGANP